MLSDVRRELEHLAAVIKRRKKPKFLFSGLGSYRFLVGAPLKQNPLAQGSAPFKFPASPTDYGTGAKLYDQTASIKTSPSLYPIVGLARRIVSMAAIIFGLVRDRSGRQNCFWVGKRDTI
jgi:hypothetical protein